MFILNPIVISAVLSQNFPLHSFSALNILCVKENMTAYSSNKFLSALYMLNFIFIINNFLIKISLNIINNDTKCKCHPLQISVREAELSGAREERDQARKDVENTHMARDEVVRKAWEVRDGAVRRKNATEVELARTRIEVMQANSQLLEAIQQKVELSQQLEQWQVRRTTFRTKLLFERMWK